MKKRNWKRNEVKRKKKRTERENGRKREKLRNTNRGEWEGTEKGVVSGRLPPASTPFRGRDCDRCDAPVTCHLSALLALLTSLGKDMSSPRSVCVCVLRRACGTLGLACVSGPEGVVGCRYRRRGRCCRCCSCFCFGVVVFLFV